MAKLKCDLHQRRVMTINGKFIHRGGWGDTCPSKTATIGETTATAAEIETFGQVKQESGAKKLLKEIFGDG